MSRWVVFDENTAAAVALAAHTEPVVSRAADCLEEGLAGKEEFVLVSPSQLPATALVARFRRPEPRPAPEPMVQYEATGFLGLIDVPINADESRPKKWWRRIFSSQP